ncbi:MAG TPA: sugar ABC transporter ATP-binding protein [bacterium]
MPSDSKSGGPAPLLRLDAIRKSFPGVQAVKRSDFELRAGEIHALVGENGAGKSTLIKVLTGAHRADAGLIFFHGEARNFSAPLNARAAGIACIYQEFAQFPALTVRENLFMGREKSRRGFFQAAQEHRTATEVFRRLGVEIDPGARLADLNIAQQQLVEIARALAGEASILVMDEPTAALAPREVDRLFAILRELAGRGIGIAFISHRLDEVLSIADRVTVMRDGETISTRLIKDVSRSSLIEEMVGRTLDLEFPKARAQMGPFRLEVRGLTGGRARDVSFSIRQGEVLGFAGLMGAGRTDVARLIFGADPKTRGDVVLDGQSLRIRSPKDAIAAGICLLTEDRKAQGLVPKVSAKDNFALSNYRHWSRWGWIHQRQELSRFQQQAKNLKLRVASPDQPASHLSGGNQQKLLAARWLESQAQVLIFDEPTRGIDVGAKYEMYLLINELAAAGKAIMMISSELPELLGMSDRILVMRQGEIRSEIADPTAASPEQIMAMAV